MTAGTSRARILCPDLVGRNQEVQTLRVFLDQTFTSTGRAVLIDGEAGVGKSALLRTFASQAASVGARFLAGECTEIEARRPFGPFAQILRSALAQPSKSIIERSFRNNPELGRLVPGASAMTLASEPIDERDRYRLYESFASLFDELAHAAPLVLAVEDLHWADEATLELFPYLARRLRSARALLVATSRGDELPKTHPLLHVFAGLERERLAERIQLQPLDMVDETTLIQGALHLARPPRADFVEAIHARCEGNPFFIEEVLKALVQHGDLVDGNWIPGRGSGGGWTAIPDTVRHAVQQRMALLPAAARSAVHIAAVIGQRFDFKLLGTVSGLSESGLLDALRAAIDAQLVVELADPDGQDRYAFRHALTREAALSELLQRERRILHRSVGEALEQREQADPTRDAAALAYHFDEARDSPRARRYHDLAAAEANHVFGFARALRHLERAVELAPNDDAGLGDLQLRLAQSAYLASDIRRAARAADGAARWFEHAGDLLRAGEALLQSEWHHSMLGSRAIAAERLGRARVILEPLGESAPLAEVYARLAFRSDIDGRKEDEAAWARRALEVGRRANAPRAQVAALRTLGLWMVSSDPEKGLSLIREGLALALEHELVSDAQITYKHLIVAMERLGAPSAELVAVQDEGLRHARRYGFRSLQSIEGECVAAVRTGDWDVALDLIDEIRGGGTTMSAALGLFEPFIVTARDGPKYGVPLLDAPRRRLLSTPDTHGVALAENMSAVVLLLAEDMRGVLRHADAAADELLLDISPPIVSSGAVCAITAAKAIDDRAAVQRWTDLALSRSPSTDPRHAQARRVFAQAERSAQEDDLDAAIVAFEDHSELFAEASLLVGTLAHLRLVELLLRRGRATDRDAANAQFASVVPFWRTAKASWYLGRLREWARERGLPFPSEVPAHAAVADEQPSSAGLAARLTPREHEIAVLVANGLSNRQIAEKLVISARTAEGHVEQVRNKLGFHSRAQIAAWVAEALPGRIDRT